MDDRTPLNVGLVVRSLSTQGGSERQARILARWLLEQGHRVEVYCAEAPDRVEGVVVHQVLPGRIHDSLGRLRLVRAARGIPRHRHDVVQAFVRVPGCDVYRAGGGAHAAWLATRGLLRRWRPRERVALWADRRAATSARRVVCNSRLAAREVREAHGLADDRVVVVRNAIDLDRFRPHPERRARARRRWRVGPEERVALFLGHGFRRKGLAVAVEAFARVAGPRDRLVVLGDDARARRRLAAHRRRLGGRLVAPGAVGAPEEWLPGADALLLPTRYDPAANATGEALACGVPPVTSGRDGNAEIVPDRGLVVDDPADVEGFAAALRYAWRTDGWTRRCRTAAEAWPVSRMGQAVVSIYRELLHG